MNDLADLLALGDAARDGVRGAVATFQRRVAKVADVGTLLDAASEFLQSEKLVTILARRALAIDPASEQAWEVLVMGYAVHDPTARRLRTRQAIVRLLEISPTNRVAVRHKLRGLVEAGDDDAAMLFARVAVRLDPSLLEAVYALARLMARSDDWDGAILELRQFKERMLASGDDHEKWLAREAEKLERGLRRERRDA
jgi:tetratricopeptide (TPR) repeat protein